MSTIIDIQIKQRHSGLQIATQGAFACSKNETLSPMPIYRWLSDEGKNKMN